MNRRSTRALFETHSRRQTLAAGRADTTITAMTYLRASRITVVSKARFLQELSETKERDPRRTK